MSRPAMITTAQWIEFAQEQKLDPQSDYFVDLVQKIRLFHEMDPAFFLKNQRVVFEILLAYNNIKNWRILGVERDSSEVMVQIINTKNPKDRLNVKLESTRCDVICPVPVHRQHFAVWDSASEEFQIFQVLLDSKVGIRKKEIKTFDIKQHITNISIKQDIETSHLVVSLTTDLGEELVFVLHVYTFEFIDLPSFNVDY